MPPLLVFLMKRHCQDVSDGENELSGVNTQVGIVMTGNIISATSAELPGNIATVPERPYQSRQVIQRVMQPAQNVLAASGGTR